MRSSLMSGLSLRLAKTSVEGGAPSFFADRTGDTVCDDCLFIIVSVLVVLFFAWVGVEGVLRKKVLEKILSVFCLRRQKTTKVFLLIIGFRKKALHFTLLSVALKKANNNNNNNNRER
jgi:hypothetical protein